MFLASRLVEETELLRPDLVKNNATRGGFDHALGRITVNGLQINIRVLEPDTIVRFHGAIRHRKFHFRGVGKQRQPCFNCRAGRAPWVLGEIVTAERNVLGRRGDRLSARGRKNVVRRQHEHTRFHLGFHRKGHVHCHLIPVEIGVVGCANQRMNSNRLALNEQGLERLDGKTMQSGRAIQQDRMPSRYLFQNIPDLRRMTLDHFLRAANRVDIAEVFQPSNDERLEKNERHFLWQPALVQFQFWPDNDDRPA